MRLVGAIAGRSSCAGHRRGEGDGGWWIRYLRMANGVNGYENTETAPLDAREFLEGLDFSHLPSRRHSGLHWSRVFVGAAICDRFGEHSLLIGAFGCYALAF